MNRTTLSATILAPLSVASLLILSGCSDAASPLAPAASGSTPAAARGGQELGGKIVFASDRDGDFQIYVMNADHSGLTRLTNTSGDAGAEGRDDDQPVWSPDGTKIAFVRSGLGYSEIWVMNADGSDQHRITQSSGEISFADRHPAWSPDGTRIVFESNRLVRSGLRELYVVNADGSSLTRLTYSTGAEIQPAWSPDGQKIVFASDRDAGAGLFHIYVMNADGTNPVRLTDGAQPDRNPAWSPDGRKIAFRSDRDGNPEIYVMDADGGRVTRLTSDPAFDDEPAWSPDGRQVVFTRYAGTGDLYVMSARGTGVVPLTANARHDVNASWR